MNEGERKFLAVFQYRRTVNPDEPWQVGNSTVIIKGPLTAKAINGLENTLLETRGVDLLAIVNLIPLEGANEPVTARLVAACEAALPEIERKAFVAGCVDDSMPPELRRLRELAEKIRAAISLSKPPGEVAASPRHT